MNKNELIAQATQLILKAEPSVPEKHATAFLNGFLFDIPESAIDDGLKGAYALDLSEAFFKYWYC